jgi:prophage tail gpP-like protein
MNDVRLVVNGQDYYGWQSLRISRGIDAIAGSFSLDVTDRWTGAGDRWPIREENECTLKVDGETLISGYVDAREISLSSSRSSISVHGRDKTGALVDCSCDIGAFEFTNISTIAFLSKVCDQVGVSISDPDGLLPTANIPKASIDPGDTCFDVIDRECRKAGVLPISDGNGGIVISIAGSARASSGITEGVNLLSATASYDVSRKHYSYKALGQSQATQSFSGSSVAQIKGEAIDESTSRTDRHLIVRVEGNATVDYAMRRAEWEATVRAATSHRVSVVLPGWRQEDGSLWPLNSIVRVVSPSLEVNSFMLVVDVEITKGPTEGEKTRLSLCRPDAFIPMPTIPNGSIESQPWGAQ